MIPESKALAWIANLQEQFNSIYVQPGAIIPQEPIEYVRKQFLTGGESLKHIYSELLEGALPIFTLGCLDERTLFSLRNEENIEFLSDEISNISIKDNREREGEASLTSSSCIEDCSSKQKGNIEMGLVIAENRETEMLIESSKASILANSPVLDKDCDNVGGLTTDEVDFGTQVNSSTSVQCSVVMEYHEKTEENDNFEAHSAPKIEECKLRNKEATISAGASSTEAINSSGLLECIDARDALTELSGESTQLNGWQNLEDHEFCSDSDMEGDNVFYQKTKSRLLDKKFIEIRLCKIASQGFDEEKEAKEWEKLDNYLCDSDWEIV